MIYIRIEKIRDLKYDNKHPNDINNGYTHQGFTQSLPTVGSRFVLGNGAKYASFMTSVVKEITGSEFTTENSVYKYFIIDENEN